MTMFNKIRYHLLFSHLLIFTFILVVFAGAVRVLVVRSFNDILDKKLLDLGQYTAANTKFNEGHITIDNDVNLKDLLAREQVLEVFDQQGNIVVKQGQYVTPKPNPKQIVPPVKIGKNIKINRPVSRSIKKEKEKEKENPDAAYTLSVKSLVLPLVKGNNDQVIGYVRVSQSLKELNEDIGELDWSLGIGIIITLILSGISGIYLTRQAMEPIEESFQRLKQFTSDASHELRSPLMAIKTNAQVALKYTEGMRKSDQEKFAIIASASQQLTQLTEDLLFLARSDKLPAVIKNKINLTSLLEDLVSLNYAQFEAKKITLEVEIDEGMFFWGDSGQISRLFHNLLTNALHYTPCGGKVAIKAYGEGSHLYVTIQDTGIGIAPENLERIFERFWRAEQSRSYWEGGSGLGLAIAQSIAQNHGGLITVTSELGVGSCFTVCLPCSSQS